MNLVSSSLIVYLNKWLPFSTYRSIFAGTLFAIVPISVWLSESLSALSQLLVIRLTLALAVSLMALVITRKWYWHLAALMVVLSLATPIIGGIPYGLFTSIPLQWFEVSKFFVSSFFLSGLFGYWLVKSSA
jgi:hypothetical protein